MSRSCSRLPGTLDAVRAAVANGADAVYLGAGGFNARDDGAQLTLDELGDACRLAHAHGARIYFTLNVLTKPGGARPTRSCCWATRSTAASTP